MLIDREAVTKRYLETRGCKIKVLYLDKKLAKEQARKLTKKLRTGRLKAYKCNFCDWYHIGHATRTAPKENILV